MAEKLREQAANPLVRRWLIGFLEICYATTSNKYLPAETKNPYYFAAKELRELLGKQ